MGSHQDFLTVTDLLWKGRLEPVIDRVFPLSEGIEAYRPMPGAELQRLFSTMDAGAAEAELARAARAEEKPALNAA